MLARRIDIFTFTYATYSEYWKCTTVQQRANQQFNDFRNWPKPLLTVDFQKSKKRFILIENVSEYAIKSDEQTRNWPKVGNFDSIFCGVFSFAVKKDTRQTHAVMRLFNQDELKQHQCVQHNFLKLISHSHIVSSFLIDVEKCVSMKIALLQWLVVENLGK